MLSKWTKILPVFLVEWYSLRYCERFASKDGEFVNPYSRFVIFRK